MPCPDGWQTCPGSDRRPYRPHAAVPYQCQVCGWAPPELKTRGLWLLVPDHRIPTRQETP